MRSPGSAQATAAARGRSGPWNGGPEPRLGYLPTKVVHIDLAEGLTTVSGLEGYVFAWFVVRVAGEPIGTVRVPIRGDRCPATTVKEHIARELGWRLTRLRLLAALAQPPGSRRLDLGSVVAALPDGTSLDASALPSMTVAVCTRDRTEHLALCLASLQRLAHHVEVLVVDNAPSTSATADLVARSYPHVRYVVEPRPGLDHARNRAVLETSSDILAFTDDDAVVDTAWSGVVARAFAEEPALGALTGLVLPYELETPAQELFERMGGFGKGFARRWETKTSTGGHLRTAAHAEILAAGQFGTGANMAFRRSTLDRLGGFDPALGAGTPAGGGDDLEMFHRLLACGGLLRYEPAAMVFHRHRRTLAALRAQMAANGALWAVMTAARAGRRATARQVFRVMHWYARWYWPRRITGAVLVPNRTPVAIPVAEVWGTVVAALTRSYRRSRRANPPLTAAPVPPAVRDADPAGVTTPTPTVTFDVAGKIARHDGVPTTGRISVLVTRQGEPLGRLDIETGGHPLSDRQLREQIVDALGAVIITDLPPADREAATDAAITAAVAAIRADDRHDSVPPTYSVSVVVVAADRSDGAARCVEGLLRHHSRHRVEIVVVGGRPGLRREPTVAERSGAVYVDAPRGDLASARRAGMLAATGEIVVTIDDDVELGDGWLDVLLAPFERNDVMAVCGDIDDTTLATPHDDAREARTGNRAASSASRWVDPASARRPFAPWRLGSASNAAFRVAIRDHPDLGLLGDIFAPDDGTELLYRIVRAGYTVLHEPGAVVHRRGNHRTAGPAGSSARQLAHHLRTLSRWHDLRALAGIAGLATTAATGLGRRRRVGCGAS